jgi:hypothetical protein
MGAENLVDQTLLPTMLSRNNLTRTIMSDQEKAKDEILKRLRESMNAGKFATKTTLTKGRKMFEEALDDLEQNGVVVNLGVKRAAAFWEAQGVSGNELATKLALARLRKLGDSVVFKAISIGELKEALPGTPSSVKAAATKALDELVRSKEAITFRAGRGNYVLFRKAVLDRLGVEATQIVHPDAQRSPEQVGKIVAAIYKRISEHQRSPEIPIHELAVESNVPLQELHDWLRGECESHRAIPFKGEPTMETEESHKTALWINGQPYYLIRLETP